MMAGPGDWSDWTTADRETAAVVQAQLPGAVFDIHAHVAPALPAALAACLSPRAEGAVGAVAGVQEWRGAVGAQLGVARLQGGLLIPYPTCGSDGAQRQESNRFCFAQAAADPNCQSCILISPADSPESLAPVLNDPTLRGLKPYHFFSPTQPTSASAVRDFLPDWAWELAAAQRLLIVLHLTRDRALADPKNLAAIRDWCSRYPQVPLVLAHAGRGFHYPNTVAAVRELRGLDNIWFDSAGVCETEALLAVLDEFGPRRLLWGSDFPISNLRGRCVTLGTGFAWVTTDNVEWRNSDVFGEPILVGLEALRALLDACRRFGADRHDLESIFERNARSLLNRDDEPGTCTAATYARAKQVIPGGVQLLSKRPERYAPGRWPAYAQQARGCEIWDLDGNHYLDLSMHGIGACLLGFRDPDVDRAVRRRLALGSFSTLNPPEEVELAEMLCGLHPWSEQVRFTRAGGEAMAVAVRIARATTDRSVIAVCGYHGWHDWYLAANLGPDDVLRGHLLPGLEPLGVPRELRGTTVVFHFNDRQGLERIVAEYGDRLAAVVMEPCRYSDPEPGFLEFARESAHRVGAVLIFDEITIGWRLIHGGAHLRLGVVPDIAVFAKALGNGYPIAAIIGTSAAMDGAHASFISSTYWTEGIGPTAALATLRKLGRHDVPAHCRQMGTIVQNAWRRSAADCGLPVEVHDGYPALAHFAFQHEQAKALTTLYIRKMLERGLLSSLSLYVTMAHTETVIGRYEEAIGAVFPELAAALERGCVEEELGSAVADSGFRRLV